METNELNGKHWVMLRVVMDKKGQDFNFQKRENTYAINSSSIPVGAMGRELKAFIRTKVSILRI